MYFYTMWQKKQNGNIIIFWIQSVRQILKCNSSKLVKLMPISGYHAQTKPSKNQNYLLVNQVNKDFQFN